MTETVLCNKCGKPVSYNFTVNTNATGSAPQPSIKNWNITNNTGAVASTYKMDFTATTAAVPMNNAIISTDQMCQCGGT